ncbi:MAG: hypothetical protein CME06_04505 [Gemmatimonadetes bacterium]|nr:hypothetical protein [Gemmatimonadota bacterium]
MMSSFGAESGLSLEQAPPLAIPSRFFVTAPVAIVAAGALLIAFGEIPWLSPWEPTAVALVHLGTLGFLTMAMFGAIYQILPVVAGVPVPATGIARGVHAALVLGICALAGGMLAGSTNMLWLASIVLTAASIAFLIPTGVALGRAATKNDTVRGIGLAWISLLLALSLGIILAALYALKWSPDLRRERLICHWTLAGIGWVGGLLAAVSWQVVPMFYLAPPFSNAVRKSILALVSVTVAATVLAFVFRLSQGWMLAAAIPGAIAVWWIHPIATHRALSGRRRKRVDDSVLFWRTGLSVALLVPPTAAAASLLPDPRLTALAAWLAIWGWAGTIIHGMLSRIVPFLVWFHRFAPLVGRQPTPTAKQLLPRHGLRIAFGLHASTSLFGTLGILFADARLARATGLLLSATGIAMLWWISRVLVRRT